VRPFPQSLPRAQVLDLLLAMYMIGEGTQWTAKTTLTMESNRTRSPSPNPIQIEIEEVDVLPLKKPAP
jgi:hypothetical protein